MQPLLTDWLLCLKVQTLYQNSKQLTQTILSQGKHNIFVLIFIRINKRPKSKWKVIFLNKYIQCELMILVIIYVSRKT